MPSSAMNSVNDSRIPFSSDRREKARSVVTMAVKGSTLRLFWAATDDAISAVSNVAARIERFRW
jgi:hypothetical protein